VVGCFDQAMNNRVSQQVQNVLTSLTMLDFKAEIYLMELGVLCLEENNKSL
jgi:hypothetical protein